MAHNSALRCLAINFEGTRIASASEKARDIGREWNRNSRILKEKGDIVDNLDSIDCHYL